jgi:hypothetical protein
MQGGRETEPDLSSASMDGRWAKQVSPVAPHILSKFPRNNGRLPLSRPSPHTFYRSSPEIMGVCLYPDLRHPRGDYDQKPVG